MTADLLSGKVPTIRVLRSISQFSLSMVLFIQMRLQCCIEKRVSVRVSAIPSLTVFAVVNNFIKSSLAATALAFSLLASKDSCASIRLPIHLYHCFFDRCLAAFIVLDDGSCESHPFKLRDLERHLGISCCETTLVMTSSIGITISCSLVTHSTYEIISLFFEKSVQSVSTILLTSSLGSSRTAFFIECYDGIGHGSASLARLNSILKSYRRSEPCLSCV